jgi:hypothetical protein
MISLYSIYPPLAPLGETRGAKVGVSGKVGRDRTPPLFESLVQGGDDAYAALTQLSV